jgi:hypothetical protein
MIMNYNFIMPFSTVHSYQAQKRRLAAQQQEIVRAVETLQEVERGIELRMRTEAAAVKEAVERLRGESREMNGGTENIEERMLAAMEEIQAKFLHCSNIFIFLKVIHLKNL